MAMTLTSNRTPARRVELDALLDPGLLDPGLLDPVLPDSVSATPDRRRAPFAHHAILATTRDR